MKKLLIPVAMLALVACNNDTTEKYSVDFQNMGVVGYADANGEAMYTVDTIEKERMTTLEAGSLKPDTNYLAHYHVKGDKDADACKSGGKPIDGVIGGKSFTSDAAGKVKITGETKEANLAGAAYINIHEVKMVDGEQDINTVPLCADLSKVAKQK